MQFASFTFLFFFLPITMGIYYLTPRRWKQEVMLGISILFLFCGGWMAALTELVLAALTYGAGLLLEKLRTKKALSRLTLAGTLLVQFGALIVLRSDWLYSLKAGAFHGSALFPLGLAFFVLQNAGYCIDVFRGKCRGETNWRRLGLYLLFYPRLIMGPVVSYPMVHKTICDPAFDMSRIGGGLLRFLVGMAKKLFLADWVGMLFQTLCQTSDAPYSMLVVWLGAFSQLVTLYLELSGYADMAIGIGACYGVRLPKSYGKSLFYPSIAAFADQWNRTVVQWFSHYVGTHFRGSNRFFQLLALMITWGCIGLWYGVRLPSLLFGLLIGFCLWLAHLLWRDKRTSMLRYALTLLLLSVGAVLLTLPDLPSVWNYLKIMLCGGHIAPTEADADLLRAYGLALAVSSGGRKTVVPHSACTADSSVRHRRTFAGRDAFGAYRRHSADAAGSVKEVQSDESQTAPALEKTYCAETGRDLQPVFRQDSLGNAPAGRHRHTHCPGHFRRQRNTSELVPHHIRFRFSKGG